MVTRSASTLVGKSDLQSPQKGVIKLRDILLKEYEKHSANQNFVSAIVQGGHEETLEARELWVEFLKNKL